MNDEEGRAGNRSRRPAAIATLGVATILVTPYCGLLFGCGCAWPWSGLAAQCSFFQPQSTIVCPWCEYAFAGTASVLLSAVSAALIAAKIGLGKSLSQHSAIVARTLIGTAVFLFVASIAGWITAVATEYPEFLMPTVSSRGSVLNQPSSSALHVRNGERDALYEQTLQRQP